MASVNVNVQDAPPAFGWLEGALGATVVFLSWYSLMAVKSATPAKTKVTRTTAIVPILFFGLSFIYLLSPT